MSMEWKPSKVRERKQENWGSLKEETILDASTFAE